MNSILIFLEIPASGSHEDTSNPVENESFMKPLVTQKVPPLGANARSTRSTRSPSNDPPTQPNAPPSCDQEEDCPISLINEGYPTNEGCPLSLANVGFPRFAGVCIDQVVDEQRCIFVLGAAETRSGVHVSTCTAFDPTRGGGDADATSGWWHRWHTPSDGAPPSSSHIITMLECGCFPRRAGRTNGAQGKAPHNKPKERGGAPQKGAHEKGAPTPELANGISPADSTTEKPSADLFWKALFANGSLSDPTIGIPRLIPIYCNCIFRTFPTYNHFIMIWFSSNFTLFQFLDCNNLFIVPCNLLENIACFCLFPIL